MSYIGEGEDFESGPSRFELQVTANDGRNQARGRVVVRVVDVAEEPEARNDDGAETPEDTPTVIDVLSNDRDPEGDRLRIASVGAAEHGTTSSGVEWGSVCAGPELARHGSVHLHGFGPGWSDGESDGKGDGDAGQRPAGGGRRRGGDARGCADGGRRAGQRHRRRRRPAGGGGGRQGRATGRPR